MARILLGVSGGIAAYKALELVRLATKAGHAVRVVQTPDQRSASSGAASFAALTGAPVLTDEFERDPARGAFPDQPAPEHDPLSHLELVRNADVLVIAPASGEHDRQARPRPGRQPADERGARRDLPGGRRARDEQPHVGAPGDAGEPRDAARARRDRARPRRRGAGLQGRVRRRAARRARRAARRRRGGARSRGGAGDAARRQRRATSTGCACSSPPAARASRSTRCASSATARRGAWASRSPRRPPRSAPTSPSSRPTSRSPRHPRVRYVDVATAAELQAACDGGVRRRRRAAHGRRGRRLPPRRARRRQAQEGRARRAARSTLERDRRHPRRRWPRAGARARRSSASPPSTGRARSRYGRDKLARKGLDAVVVNDIARADIGFEGAAQRGDDRHRRRRAPRRRAPPRPRSRARCSTRSSTCAPGAARIGDAGPGPALVERLRGIRPRRRGRGRTRRSRSAGASATAITRGRRGPPRAARPRARVLAAEGHVLIEDLPGVGKTTLARALARSLDLQFARVQCTADLLPADVVGTNVFNQREDRFEFRPGPDLRQRRARRRDQPRVAQDAVGPARVHAGAPRHRRRAHARAGAAVRRARHAEPGRVRGHLPAARGAGRPLHGARCRSATRAPAGEADDAARARDRRPRRRARAGRHRGRAARRPGRRAPRPRLRRAARLRRRAARAHARGPARRARRQPARRAAAAARGQGARAARRAATTRCPTTSRRCADAVLAHRIVLAPEAIDATGERSSPTRWRRRRRCREAQRMRPAVGHRAARAWLLVADRGDVRRRAAVRARRRPSSCWPLALAAWVIAAARGVRVAAHRRRAPRRRGGAGARSTSACAPARLRAARRDDRGRPAARGPRRSRSARRDDARAHQRALRAPRAQARWRRRASSCATRSASPRATSPPARRPRCSCCRASSASARRTARATAPAWPRAAGARRWRPRSSSTACARTARARPPRGSTGRRSPAAAS